MRCPDILQQVAIEGVAVSVLGGLVGLALGVLGGLFVGMAGTLVGQTLWEEFLLVDMRLLTLTILSSLGVSGLACLVPALLAARVEPAAALRL